MLAGCVLSALPAGFAAFLAGRALQGAGLGLVPLATAVARDDLPADRSRSAIVLIGVTTAAGIGIGYPVVGLLAQLLGLYAPFWFAAGLSVLALAAALAALPPSPARPARVDAAGAVLLGAGIAGLLLVLTQGPAWGWTSAVTLTGAVVSAALLAAWAGWELRARHPLIELRLLGRRAVLAANLTAFGIAIGFYPLASLAVRFAQNAVVGRLRPGRAGGGGRGHAHPVLAGQLRRQPVRRARRPAHLGRARGGGQLRAADRLDGAVPGRPGQLPGSRGDHGRLRPGRGERLRGQPAADHRWRARRRKPAARSASTSSCGPSPTRSPAR